MAKAFRVVSQRRTVLVRSPTVIEDVQEVYAETVPHGVGFVRDVPLATWQAHGAGPALEAIAEHIEHIMVNRPVLSAGPVQTVGRNGLLQNYVEFVVHARDVTGAEAQLHTSTVRIPVQALHDHTDFTSYFKPVLDALDAAAKA